MHRRFLLAFACFVLTVCAVLRAQSEENPSLLLDAWPKSEFLEIWGYLSPGEEKLLESEWPVTDVALFSASISSTGKLVGIPDRGPLKSFGGRVHLVVAEVSNRPLTYFCLSPEYPVRAKLVRDIVEAAKPFDGVQIDFEQILDADAEHFATFLADIRKGIGKRMLSVALPARTRRVRDAFDYDRIGPIVDRVIVMAYDEHWSGSKPGPIASFAWGVRVAGYALDRLGSEKTVMGMPFYGRAWADANPARAYRNSTLQTVLAERDNIAYSRQAGIPTASYSQTVNVTVFYEDAQSLADRARIYRNLDVLKIGFWKIGQEDRSVWPYLKAVRRPSFSGGSR